MDDLFHGPRISRRSALTGLGAALTLAQMPKARAGVAFPQRLLIVNILGGMDGLSAVIPYGDPNLAGLRAPLMPPPVGQQGGMFDLGGFYGLNPAFPNLYSLYLANQLLPVHAVGNVVYTRSHFQGQETMQTGAPGGVSSGWMNRLVSLFQNNGQGVEPGLVLGSGLPIIAQGSTGVAAWSSDPFKVTPNQLAALVETLGAPDPLIGQAIQSGFNDTYAFQSWMKGRNGGGSNFDVLMNAAGVMLSAPGGPAVAVVQTAVMDTHTNQVSRLGPLLSDLDSGIAAFGSALGSAWANTVVITITEFGRTAAVNGSLGTDHGTGLAMFLAGGPVSGGRCLPSQSDWPGLATGQLYQKRDLQPFYDMRQVVMGVLQDHMGLNQAQLATVFPSAGVSPLGGLISGG